jgi:hypothetical protein
MPSVCPDLVHRHRGQVVEHEALRLRAAGIEIAARLEHVERIGHLVAGHVGVVAGAWIGPALRQVGGDLHHAVPVGTVGEHLGPDRPARSRVEALDRDVGIEDLAATRVDVARAGRAEGGRRVGHPAHRRDADVERVEVGIVRLDPRLDRVLEADALERLVPLEDAGRDRVAVLQRDRAVEPVDDRLDRLRQLGRRVLLLEPPALDVAHGRRARQVVAVVLLARAEEADRGVGRPRRHRLGRQAADRIVQRHEQAARIGQRARRARHRRAGRRAGLRHAIEPVAKWASTSSATMSACRAPS